jgi:hypothetical protein
MVEEYTQRKLTVGTDRLPAFAGVASEMQGHLGVRYFAGLWEDSFVTTSAEQVNGVLLSKAELGNGGGFILAW